MLTNQKIQAVLKEIKDITGIDNALCTSEGAAIGGTMDVTPGMKSIVLSMSENNYTQIMGCTFIRFEADGDAEYVLIMNSDSRANEVVFKMAASQVKNVAVSLAERYDRNNFIQNVLLGNMLPVDLQMKAKKLHIDSKPRVAFVIDAGKNTNEMAIELVKNLSDMKSGDFVTSLDQNSIILIKDMSYIQEKDYEQEMADIAAGLVDSISMEAMIKVRVGYGNVRNQINEIVVSYQEARMALEVGKVFYAQMDTISYGKLGIGRLIYQLPMSLCEMYIKEVFGDEIPEILDDEEAMSTISKFFENSLNISETARQLYVHRNTLVYRLERIEKSIGLDIRNFEEAMIFRIAVMVLAHMKNTRV